MFGWLKKDTSAEADGYDPEQVTTYYEGGVMSPDYVAETLDRPDVN